MNTAGKILIALAFLLCIYLAVAIVALPVYMLWAITNPKHMVHFFDGLFDVVDVIVNKIID